MQILDWLDAPLREMLLSTLLGGLAVSVMGAILSVFVVLKRMSFIGQGVSHSAFGGIGLAAILGAAGLAAATTEAGVFLIILLFCLLSALGMAMTSDREAVESDTAIGVFLVASMALGAVLVAIATRMGGATGAGSWERALFGTVIVVDRSFAWIAAIISVLVLAAIAWFRRGLVFWSFDEPAAEAFGVPAQRMKLLLVILLAIATVTAMRLAGIVFATALLVLPGAAALRLSSKFIPVLAISSIIATLALVTGVWLSIEADLPTGASIVLVLTLLFALSCAAGAARARRPAPPAPPAPAPAR